MSQEPLSVEQLTADLDKRRASLAADVEALAQRLSPASIKQSLIGGFTSQAKAKVSSLSNSVASLKSHSDDESDSTEDDHSPSILSAAKKAAKQASQEAEAVSYGEPGVAPSEVDERNVHAFDANDPWAPSPQAQEKLMHRDTETDRSVQEKLKAVLPTCLAGDDDCPVRQTVADAHKQATRLINDARDGDPQSLGIVTAAALVLTGVSVVALIKAVRS